MRCTTLIFLILFMTVLPGKMGFSQEKISITKVVIDAGHGGKDPGTIGKKSQEKEITLQIALKLAALMREQCKDVTVICTRTTDEFVELFERAEIANRSKADLFISIHCNANPKNSFHGAETYIMGLHRTSANLEIAKKENASILMEPDYSTNYQGFDPNTDESYITFTLFQNAFLDQSTELASDIQDEMKDRVGMNDRGVRQAGFLVLYKTTMPSVLVETGFLSNPEEERFLMSQKGQQYIASAICRAFTKFKAKIEGSGTEPETLSEKPAVQPRKQENNPPQEEIKPAEKTTEKLLPRDTMKLTEKLQAESISNDSLKTAGKSKAQAGHLNQPHPKDTIVKKENTKVIPVRNEKKSQDLAVKTTGQQPQKPKESPIHKDSSSRAAKPKTEPVKKEKAKPDIPRKDTVKQSVKQKVQTVHKDSVQGKEKAKTISRQPEKPKPDLAAKTHVKPVEKAASKPVEAAVVIFRVQITSISKNISIHDKKFSGLPDVWVYTKDKLFKYTAGSETTLEGAKTLLDEIRKKGFSDAFIVAFHAGERITIDEAKKLLSEKEHTK